MHRFIFCLLSLSVLVKPASAQFNVRDSARQAFLVDVSAALALPVYDLKERFGPFASLGLGVHYMTKKGWIAGLNAGFQFNERVFEKDAIAAIRTTDGFLIGGDGTLYDLLYQMRSLQCDVSLSRRIPHTGNNRNSGLFAGLGVGYFDHRIRYEPEDRNAPLPQLSRDMRKGYDRLSGGFMVRPMIGYRFLGNKRLVNFFVQIEHAIAATNSLRTFQFDQMGTFIDKRTDGYWSFRFGWVLPIYRKPATEYFAF